MYVHAKVDLLRTSILLCTQSREPIMPELDALYNAEDTTTAATAAPTTVRAIDNHTTVLDVLL
jgi:hypothetical protein